MGTVCAKYNAEMVRAKGKMASKSEGCCKRKVLHQVGLGVGIK